jgi:thiol-disulfide isomerase/thioredoxin
MNAMKTLLLLITLAVLSGCAEKAPPAATVTQEPPPAAPAAEKAPVQPEPAAVPSARAELGKPAPDFTLTDIEGKPIALSALKGKTVVLEWFNPECPFVKAAHGKGELQTMAKKVVGKDVIWLSINSGAPGKQGHGVDRNRAALAEFAMGNPILLDEDGAVGHAYGAEKTPTLFVIDAKGVLVYRGGIDNAPMNVVDDARPRAPGQAAGTRVNYVQAALDELAKGKKVTLSETPAYGCSVKYSG